MAMMSQRIAWGNRIADLQSLPIEQPPPPGVSRTESQDEVLTVPNGAVGLY
jgi:hypothetical protein